MPSCTSRRCLLHVTTLFLMSLFISPSWMLMWSRGKRADGLSPSEPSISRETTQCRLRTNSPSITELAFKGEKTEEERGRGDSGRSHGSREVGKGFVFSPFGFWHSPGAESRTAALRCRWRPAALGAAVTMFHLYFALSLWPLVGTLPSPGSVLVILCR